MKVSLDISALNPNFKEHATRGIGRYVRELYANLKKQESGILLNTFDQSMLLNNIEQKIISNLPFGKQSVSQQIFIPYKLRSIKKNCDFIHYPSHTDVPLFSPKPYIVTVLDLIYLVFKDLYIKGNLRARFARKLEIESIKRADMLIAISECTKRDVCNILKVRDDKIKVVYLAVDESFYSASHNKDFEEKFRREHNLTNDTKLILYVGGIDQRKNYKTLLETVSILKEKYSDNTNKVPFKLIMVGRIQKDKQYPIYRNLIKEYGIDDFVIETGFMDDNNLKSLYKFSNLLFFPSLYEGFGFTPLEALASGLPVVCSNTPAVKEVVGDFALTCDPKDARQFASYIDTLFFNASLCKKMSSEGIIHARNFSWDETARKTLDVYEDVYKLKTKK